MEPVLTYSHAFPRRARHLPWRTRGTWSSCTRLGQEEASPWAPGRCHPQAESRRDRLATGGRAGDPHAGFSQPLSLPSPQTQASASPGRRPRCGHSCSAAGWAAWSAASFPAQPTPSSCQVTQGALGTGWAASSLGPAPAPSRNERPRPLGALVPRESQSLTHTAGSFLPGHRPVGVC